MKQQLTDRQAEILAYIKRYIAKFGYPPSIRAIGDRFDMNVNGVSGHLRALQTKGHITRAAGLPRAIKVLD